MPTLTASSLFSQLGDQYSLSLRVSHHLILGEPGNGAHTVSAKQLQDLDVAPWHDGVSLVLRAAEHRTAKIAPANLQASSLLAHFRDSLHANLDGLGLDEIEERLDGDNLCIDLTMNPPSTSRPPRLYLRAIHLDYVWKATQESAEAHIFSPNLLLPDIPVLDSLFQRLITYHLVGRYPLIFGPYSRRLDAERNLFQSIARKILTIAVRSPNTSHRKSTRRLIARMRASHERETDLIVSRVSVLAPSGDDISESMDDDRVSDTRAITFALERLYRKALRPRRFKVKMSSAHSPPRQAALEGYPDSDLDIHPEDGLCSTQPALADHASEEHNDIFAVSDGHYIPVQEDHTAAELARDMLDLFADDDSENALLIDEDDQLDESLLFSDDDTAMLSDEEDIFSPRPYPQTPISRRSASPDERHIEPYPPMAVSSPRTSTPRAPDALEDHEMALDFDDMNDDDDWPPTPQGHSPTHSPPDSHPYSASSWTTATPDALEVDPEHDTGDREDLCRIFDHEQDLSHSPLLGSPSKEPPHDDTYPLSPIPASYAEYHSETDLADLALMDRDDCLSFDD
ncbi:unnamed protein product [Peniophora sp. CBMAI 1063]|nr:unnamed protein product [Peniophora sp. CBMAI 1063]